MPAASVVSSDQLPATTVAVPSSVAAIKHLHAGNAGAASVGNRAGKMHPAGTGDEVAVRGPAIAGERHRRERLARRRGVDDDGLRVGGAAGIAGQVGDRDLEIVVGAGRQRGVERPVAGHHGCRAEQRAAIKHLHAGNAGAAGVGNRAGKMHPAGAGDEVAVRGPGIAGQRHRRERLARRRGVERIAVAGAGRDIVGRINAAHRQRAGARRQRHPARRPVPAPAVASTQVVPPRRSPGSSRPLPACR